MEKVKINVADFEDAMNLKAAVFKAAADAGLDLNKLGEMDVAEAIKAIISVDVSPSVYSALWPCLVRCTYRGAKITKETFEAEEMRQLYYPIAIECMKVNIAPFLAGLLSAWSGIGSLAKLNILKSK